MSSLIILSFFCFSLCYIELPFKKKMLSECPFPNSCYEYISEISLGTPLQKLYLKLSSNKYSFFIISDENYGTEIRSFYCMNSSSLKYHEDFDLNGEFYTGRMASDDALINNINIPQFHFPLAEILCHDNDYEGLSGLLGLGCHQIDTYGNDLPNFIKNLKGKDVIDSYDFSFKFLDDDNGLLQIGKRPDELEGDNFKVGDLKTQTTPIESYPFWGAMINQMVLFGRNVPFDISKTFIEIQIEENFITGIDLLNTTLYNNFFKPYIDKGICHVLLDHYYFYYICNDNFDGVKSFGDLIMYNEGLNFNFTFSPEELFEKKEDKYYFLIRFYAFAKTKRMIIGDRFLRKYKILFNSDKKTIGMYIHEKKEESSNKFKVVVFIVYFLLLLICICIIAVLGKYILNLRKKFMKRRRAVELNDDFEYVNTKEKELI